jgi:hypothetical protein
VYVPVSHLFDIDPDILQFSIFRCVFELLNLDNDILWINYLYLNACDSYLTYFTESSFLHTCLSLVIMYLPTAFGHILSNSKIPKYIGEQLTGHSWNSRSQT